MLQSCVQNVSLREDWIGRFSTWRPTDPGHEVMDTCIRLYDRRENGELPILPDRVLWIEAKGFSKFKLLDSKNIRAEFIALSNYRGSRYMKDIYPLKEKKDDVILAMLPPLFQDTIRLARMCKVQYVWFDQPCINQGVRPGSHSLMPEIERINGNGTKVLEVSGAVTEEDSVLSFLLDLNVNIPEIGNISLEMGRC